MLLGGGFRERVVIGASPPKAASGRQRRDDEQVARFHGSSKHELPAGGRHRYRAAAPESLKSRVSPRLASRRNPSFDQLRDDAVAVFALDLDAIAAYRATGAAAALQVAGELLQRIGAPVAGR